MLQDQLILEDELWFLENLGHQAEYLALNCGVVHRPNNLLTEWSSKQSLQLLEAAALLSSWLALGLILVSFSLAGPSGKEKQEEKEAQAKEEVKDE